MFQLLVQQQDNQSNWFPGQTHVLYSTSGVVDAVEAGPEFRSIPAIPDILHITKLIAYGRPIVRSAIGECSSVQPKLISGSDPL